MTEHTGWLRSQPASRAGPQQPPVSTGHHVGLHPEDVPNHTNDPQSRHTSAQRETMYDDRDESPVSHSSARRYGTALQQASPRTIVRVTRHQGPPVQRASLMQPQTEEPYQLPRAQRKRFQKPWPFYVGLCLLVMLVGWILLSMALHGIQVLSDNLTYGTPRTFQCDADVGHGGVSHFTLENLHGHIVITEVQVDNPAKAKIYLGPVLTGTDADLAPATITFTDVNGDGIPDMVLTVENTQHVFLGTKDGFQMNGEGNP